MSANTTLESLRKAALDRGANLLIDVEFEGSSGWSTNPQCRRNLNWGWLIIPMFLPIPQSVSIRGTAISDPAFNH